jgi:NAD+ kinase
MRIGIIGHKGYEGVPEALRTIRASAKTLGMQISIEPDIGSAKNGEELLESPEKLDALLTLGGDGTLLRGARFLKGRQIPILGVNLGRLGFLTSCQGSDLGTALKDFSEGKFVAEARMVLGARAVDANGATKHEWRALNDFVLHKGGFARVVRLGITVDGASLGSYACDGVVICTPTGSTAYSLSAGGPVVVPTVESIIITPVSAHTLAVRPLVVPHTAEISVQADDSATELLVTVDGQVGANFRDHERLVVRRAEDPVLVVRFQKTTFFEKIRVKLGWGGLPDRD